MSEKSRFNHRIRALHRRAGLLKTEAGAITERFSHGAHQERTAGPQAPAALYSTPTIGPERGEKT